MRKTVAFLLPLVMCASPLAEQTRQVETLDIYFIDTEGGQATLFVSPSGESALVDSGNPGGRDVGRIMAVVRDVGLTQIDYLVTTHYHRDHIGGMPELAAQIPIRHFVDHGPSRHPRVPCLELMLMCYS